MTADLPNQRAELRQVGQALSQVVRTTQQVNEQRGYGFGEGGCLFGARLRPGSGAQQSFSLVAGQLPILNSGLLL